MKFKDPVFEGVFLKRYKRFFADIRLNNQIVVAHVANTGSMKGLVEKEAPCWVTFNNSPDRKLKYTLQAIQTPTSWVGVNTSLPNPLVVEAFKEGRIKKWLKYKDFKSEVKINPETRLDLQLIASAHDPALFIEIKNVTLADKGVALFPDAVTSRGLKHLNELIELVRTGHRAEMVYVVQRTDCDVFRPAAHIDPDYADGLQKAAQAGVEISAYATTFKSEGFELDASKVLKVEL